MTTPICTLCCDLEDPFPELDWKKIATDVFKSLPIEEQQEPVEACKLPDHSPVTHRNIITGDDTEDDDSDEEFEEEDDQEDDQTDTEEDDEEVAYYDQLSSSLYSGAHHPRRSKAHLMQDIRKLYTINQVLLVRMNRLLTELDQERAHKHQLIQAIQSRLATQSVS